MLRTMLRTGSLTIGSLLMVGSALAHPGHDHNGADHQIHEMPAGGLSNMDLLGLGLLIAALVCGVFLTGRQRRSKR